MANFTQTELELIYTTFENIKNRMDLATFSSLNPNDKPIADGYAMMANLLQNRLNNDSSLSSADRQCNPPAKKE